MNTNHNWNDWGKKSVIRPYHRQEFKTSEKLEKKKKNRKINTHSSEIFNWSCTKQNEEIKDREKNGIIDPVKYQNKWIRWNGKKKYKPK